MIEEDKQLLLKDLCARLLYGLHVKIYNHWADSFEDEILSIDNISEILHNFPIEDIKPYLRSMSSMTEEEKLEWRLTFAAVYDLVPGGDPDNEDDYDDNWHDEADIESFDWLYAHHFDYRGLINKGLALETPEDMYKFE